MKLFRFMSNVEFQKYRSGKVMKNKKDHHKTNHNKTNSVGFCFLDLEEYKPEYALHFLSGIVDFSVCAIFEVDPKDVIKTYGRYAEPITDFEALLEMSLVESIKMLGESFIANEYCTKEYSRRNFKLIKYTTPNWYDWDNWKWEECNNEIQTTKRNKRKDGKRDKAI